MFEASCGTFFCRKIKELLEKDRQRERERERQKQKERDKLRESSRERRVSSYERLRDRDGYHRDYHQKYARGRLDARDRDRRRSLGGKQQYRDGHKHHDRRHRKGKEQDKYKDSLSEGQIKTKAESSDSDVQIELDINIEDEDEEAIIEKRRKQREELLKVGLTYFQIESVVKLCGRSVWGLLKIPTPIPHNSPALKTLTLLKCRRLPMVIKCKRRRWWRMSL